MNPLDRIIIATSAIALLTLEAVLLTNIRTKGYVITTKGDTLNCSFKLNLNKYQLKKDSAYYQLKPDSIQEYHLTKKNKNFKAVILPDKFKKVFMLVIDTGQINLYQYFKSQGKVRTMYLIAQKGAEQPVIIFGPGGSNQQKAALTNIINDNSKVAEDFKYVNSYNPKTITSIIKAYNGKTL